MSRRASKMLFSALMLLVAVIAPPASAHSSQVDSTDLRTRWPVYLALGDSVANGQQSADIVPGDYWATVAAWQANGYVAQLGDYLKAHLDCTPGRGKGCDRLQVLNIARSAVPKEVAPPAGKPGVTTQSVIDEQLPVAVPLLRKRSHDHNPSNDVKVVTLTVGGNDVVGPILAACLPTPGPTCMDVIKTSFDSFSRNYNEILAALRHAAGRNTQIVTMTYYNPMRYCYLASAAPFVDWVLEGGTFQGMTLPGGYGFNELIERISARNHAMVTDTVGDLASGDFVGGQDCLHPNRNGQTKLAAAFAEVVRTTPRDSR